MMRLMIDLSSITQFFFTPNALEVLVPGMAEPAPAAPVDSPTPEPATLGTLAVSE